MSTAPPRRHSAVKRALTFPSRQMRRGYDWGLRRARSRYALGLLALFSFFESFLFLIPFTVADYLLIPVTLAKPKRWWLVGTVATVGSTLGAIVAWVIGYGFYEALGRPLIEMYELETQFEAIDRLYEENALWAIIVAGLTPIPYKAFTLAAGVFQISLAVLIIGSIIGRGARFFGTSLLVSLFGAAMTRLIEKYFGFFSIVFVVVVVLGLVLISRLVD